MPDTRHSDPDFDWLLRARDEIQKAMRDLLEFGTTRRAVLLAGDDDTPRTVFSLLVGVGFSLWRAAFLSDIARTWPEIIDKGNQLLRTVLITNSVPFSTDREVRNWMMGYYLNNARYRLADARDRLEAKSDTEALAKFAALHPHGITDIDALPTEIWDVFMITFRELLDSLKRQTAGG